MILFVCNDWYDLINNRNITIDKNSNIIIKGNNTANIYDNSVIKIDKISKRTEMRLGKVCFQDQKSFCNSD